MNNPCKIALACFCGVLVSTFALQSAAKAQDVDQTLLTLQQKIDMKLYEQCKADIRAWLDARIEAAGYTGMYDFWNPRINPKGNRVNIDLNRGAFADTAAQFLRAYEMLGDEKYLAAGLKTAAEYTYDGHEAWTQGYKTYRYDQPRKYPSRIKHVWLKDAKPWYGWDKVQMDDSKIVVALLERCGREALRERFRGPVEYDRQQYLQARIAAARRSTDENFTVQLQPLDAGDGSWLGHGHFILGKYLDRVRQRLARPDAELPARDLAGRSGMCRQAWKSQLAGYNIVPYGWAQWQYVWDVSLALGKIGPDAAAKGGLGLESERLAQPWDMMWHWESRSIDVEDWMDVPLAENP